MEKKCYISNSFVTWAKRRNIPVTYKTVVLVPYYDGYKNVLTQDMLNEENVKYAINYDYWLNGETITVPENSILEFDGGTLHDGTIIGQNTFINDIGGLGLEKLFAENIVREGTWRINGEQVQSDWNQNDNTKPDFIKNKPIIDTELSDTSTNPVQNRVINIALNGKQPTLESGQNIKTINGQSVLGSGNIQIGGVTVDTALSKTSTNPVQNKVIAEALEESGNIDKSYDPTKYSGLGRKTLKLKEDGSNVLMQTDFDAENTIYVIQYDFTLGEGITVPANCVLEFEGGSISGAYTITGDNTGIQAGFVKIFNTDVSFAGSWNIVETYPEWFGAKGDGVSDDTASIKKSVNLATYSGHKCKLQPRQYSVYDTIDLGNNIEFYGVLSKNRFSNTSSTFLCVHHLKDWIVQANLNCYVHDIAFYEPDQKVIDEDTVSYQYGWCIHCGLGNLVENISFVNVYNGIKVEGEHNDVSYVLGCVLNCGLEVVAAPDVCRFEAIQIGSNYVFNGQIVPEEERQNYKKYAYKHCVGVHWLRGDWCTLVNCFFLGLNKGLYLDGDSRADTAKIINCGFDGCVTGIHNGYHSDISINFCTFTSFDFDDISIDSDHIGILSQQEGIAKIKIENSRFFNCITHAIKGGDGLFINNCHFEHWLNSISGTTLSLGGHCVVQNCTFDESYQYEDTRIVEVANDKTLIFTGNTIYNPQNPQNGFLERPSDNYNPRYRGVGNVVTNINGGIIASYQEILDNDLEHTDTAVTLTDSLYLKSNDSLIKYATLNSISELLGIKRYRIQVYNGQSYTLDFGVDVLVLYAIGGVSFDIGAFLYDYNNITHIKQGLHYEGWVVDNKSLKFNNNSGYNGELRITVIKVQ